MKRITVLQLLLLSAGSLTRPRTSGWEARTSSSQFTTPRPLQILAEMNPQYTDSNSCFSGRIHAFSLAHKVQSLWFFFKDIYCSGEFNHIASFHKTRSSLAGLVAVKCDAAALRAGGSRPWTVPCRQAHVERRGETAPRGPCLHPSTQ